MDSLEKSLVNPDNDDLLGWDFQANKINQVRNASCFESQGTWLSKTWKPLVTSTIAIALSLGADYGKPNTVLAQEVSATWAETINLTSILTGYESILLGLEEVGMGGEVAVFDHSLIFSETIAAFTMTGTIGDMDLILNGQGFLSGDVGDEDLSWTGNWLGTLGTQFFTADDTGTFSVNGTDGYTNLNFQQSGFKDSDMWDATTTGELTSNIGGSLLPGWARSGTEGIGGEVSTALADLETQFISSGNSIGSFLTIDGDAESFILVLEDSTIIKEGNYSCEENKNCTKTKPVPEPTPSGTFLMLLALGVIRRVWQFK